MSQKIAYVTGGMGGIGTAICRRLHTDGFKVIAGCGPSRDHVKWLDEQKARIVPMYRDRCHALADALESAFGDRIRFHRPEGGMFLWTEFDDVPDTKVLLQHAVEAGVAGIPTAFMAESGEEGPLIGFLGEFDALAGLSQQAGLAEPVPVEAGGAQVYFGLAGTNLQDDERTIPFFQTERQRFLEFDLTKLVYELSNPKRPVVGVMSSLPKTSAV